MPDPERLRTWLVEALAPERKIIYKRLSANDTGATGAHQVGLYLPKRFTFLVAPELDADTLNPRRAVPLRLDSHGHESTPHLTYYNNRRGGRTRDECRMTGFGGRGSALQDPESTSAVLVLSFDRDGRRAFAWLATTLAEEEVIEAAIGPIAPGVVGYIGTDEAGVRTFLEDTGRAPDCRAEPRTLPSEWSHQFPSGQQLADESARRILPGRMDVDALLIRRRDCEFALFRVVETIHVMPRIGAGFTSIDEFLSAAQSVLQRRKSRAGRSLELQLARILVDTHVSFDAQATTERGHRPDFVFPSLDRYRAARVGDPDLAVLAAKSTLRDRWRQVLEEADKVPVKHLFTLDQGVSVAQFREMSVRGIVLVVPRPNISSFPASIRPSLLTLRAFIDSRIGGRSVV